MNSLRNEILSACLVPYDGYFRGGQRANNKLEVERLSHYPELRDKIVQGLSKLVELHHADVVIGVPHGATWLAEEIAVENDINTAVLDKSPDGDNIFFESEEDRQTCTNAWMGVVVEDFTTLLTSTRRTLAIPEIAVRAVGVVAIWDRGRSADREDIEIPLETLVDEYIPPILPKNSSLWEFAR